MYIVFNVNLVIIIDACSINNLIDLDIFVQAYIKYIVRY